MWGTVNVGFAAIADTHERQVTGGTVVLRHPIYYADMEVLEITSIQALRPMLNLKPIDAQAVPTIGI